MYTLGLADNDKCECLEYQEELYFFEFPNLNIECTAKGAE